MQGLSKCAQSCFVFGYYQQSHLSVIPKLPVTHLKLRLALDFVLAKC